MGIGWQSFDKLSLEQKKKWIEFANQVERGQ
jgi:hypothetical protein